MPIVADAEQFFADEHDGFALCICRTFYVCPRCGKDTAPTYEEICQERAWIKTAYRIME